MLELISRVPSRYYLAYGSNLDMERMGKRCPYAVVVGTTEMHLWIDDDTAEMFS